MKNNYSHCIFCHDKLTRTDIKGCGEHVIPARLYGSWCIKDVCKSCNNYLGSKVDSLAIEDNRIISAVFKLKLPELQSAIRDRGAGRSIDITDGSELPVTFKGGIPKVASRLLSDQLFVCDESESRKHLANLLRKRHGHQLSPLELNQVIDEEIVPQYNRLAPGKSVEVPRLGLRVRKAPCSIHQDWKVTEDACHRLVAKIGYEFAHIAFEYKRLLAVTDLAHLVNTARGEERLDSSILMYPIHTFSPINAPPKGPKYHHQIIAWYEDYANIIDIYFFGCVGFRLMLCGDGPSAYGPCPVHGELLDMFSIAMTFEPESPQTKRYFYRRAGETEIMQGGFA